MKIYSLFDNTKKNNFKNKEGLLLIGYFDAIHRGHQEIIKYLTKISYEMNLNNFILTYKSIPSKDIKNKKVLELKDKISIIKNFGVKNLILNEFNEIQDIEADDFLKILIDNFNIRHFLISEDFSFGKDKKGNIENLKNNNIKFIFFKPIIIDGMKISTKIIKNFILSGDIEEANRLLGRNFYIKGIVKKGKQFGRKIGFPTMNIYNDEIIHPKNGSYITKTFVGSNEYYSMTYVTEDIIETHLIGFNDFQYNFKINIDFFKKIRDNSTFENIFDLQNQLRYDLIQVKKYFNLN